MHLKKYTYFCINLHATLVSLNIWINLVIYVLQNVTKTVPINYQTLWSLYKI